MRTKLFLSYSKGDIRWRRRFLRHMKTMVSIEDGLWVDRESIGDGTDWCPELTRGLADSRCALLLLTPQYLARGTFANDNELPMLLEERARGLKLLPVLVEPCSWESQHPDLSTVQFIGWRNGTKQVVDENRTREVVRAVSEAGDEAATRAERWSAINRAVMDVCEHVRRAFGVVGQITEQQRNDLFDETTNAFRSVLEAERVTLEKEPIHCGDFAVVYRGMFEGKPVAVKAVPTAAWRNRVHTALDSALSTSDLLRDSSFVRVKRCISNPEVHAIVMEYVDWPTLDKLLDAYPGRRLPAQDVARILARIARAQHDAHKRGAQVGALSTASIHVNKECEVRLTPIRVEAHLARGLALSTGQLVNWDILTMLTPEIHGGYQPLSREDLDAHEQYYLGLLGVELLLGRRPVAVSCFKDLALKAAFFEDPRAFFDTGAGDDRWTDDSPALAYVLAKMLSRRPADRFESANVAKEELRRVAEGRLPDALRRTLEADLGEVISQGFAGRFYQRLFTARPSLEAQFRDPAAQSRMLADAVRDLVEFRSEDRASRFLDHVSTHKGKYISAEDVEAFRRVFVAEVIATCDPASGGLSPQSRGDAWNAALKLGLGVMLKGLQSAPLSSGNG